MEKEVNGREKLTKLIGEDAYNEYTRLSTAEKISEVMEKIKLTFIDFVKTSGLFDFITNPQRVNAFIKSATGMLAGAINTIGEIIASVLDAMGSVIGFFGGDSGKWQGLAEKVRGGTGTIAGGMTAAVANIGGTAAPSVGNTMQAGARQQQTAARATTAAAVKPITIVNNVQNNMDGKIVQQATYKHEIETAYTEYLDYNSNPGVGGGAKTRD